MCFFDKTFVIVYHASLVYTERHRESQTYRERQRERERQTEKEREN